MSVRCQADADLDQTIVTALLRREPGIDFQTVSAAGLTRNVARSLANVGRRYDAFQLLKGFLHKLPQIIAITLSSVAIDNNSSVLAPYALDSVNRHVILSCRREKEKVHSVENARSGWTEAGFLPVELTRTMERRAPCSMT
jgi:hypothetical protein